MRERERIDKRPRSAGSPQRGPEAGRRVRTLKIFDFDGTLASTVLPEVGMAHYERVTGQPWPAKGWWGRPESLSPPVTELMGDGPALSDFFAEVEGRTAAEPFLLVMMTGRLSTLSRLVEHWLDARGVVVDVCLYHGGSGSTFDVKVRHIVRLLAQHPSATAVELWEDRPEHAWLFERLDGDASQLGRAGVRVSVHRVGPAAVVKAGTMSLGIPA
jgi:hypothetical protein